MQCVRIHVVGSVGNEEVTSTFAYTVTNASLWPALGRVGVNRRI
jgi:hypothetical protein